MNKLPSTDLFHFGHKRGFGPHQDVIDILLMTHKVLKVKCTVAAADAAQQPASPSDGESIKKK
jgi:hypothetical protein